MKNEFLIYIKLLAIDPETGKAFAPPCMLQPQLVFNLFYYIEEFKRDQSHNPAAYKNAIEEILKNIQSSFGVPLGWMIEMQSTDEFFALDNPFYQPEQKFSEEFLYSPDLGKTEINVEFMWDWAVSAVSSRFQGEKTDVAS